MSFLNAKISNDFYAKDTSRKVRAVIQAKGKSGQHLNRPMYGYREAPNAKGRWIIDEETAPVVKRMFDWTMAGQGTKQIADLLESEKVYNLSTKRFFINNCPRAGFPGASALGMTMLVGFHDDRL